MAHIEDVLLQAISREGSPYVFGAEALPTNAKPAALDCSELVEWACARSKVKPAVPDGAYYQWRHCANSGTLIKLNEGYKTRGALLFTGDGTGEGREAITHVALSLGDGRTIEARGKKWGVGTWACQGRFNFAGRIPSVDYSAGHKAMPPKVDQERNAKYPGGVFTVGAVDPFVKTIQKMLKGFKLYLGVVDGKYREATKVAVREWQRGLGFKGKALDGEWGPDTQKATDAYLAKIGDALRKGN